MSHKFMPVRFLLLLTVVLSIVGLRVSGAGSRPQTKPARTSPTKLTKTGAQSDVVTLSAPAKPAPVAGFKGGNAAAFELASSSNMQLRTSLEWDFGGKAQMGWNLYTPLIGDLIGARADAASNEFAMRLSVWQRENGIDPTGVLDGETWSQMVSRFQARRSSGRPYLAPNQLATIPISDCYDPTRAEELRSAERETFAAYKRMVAAAAADSSIGLQVGRDGQLTSSEKFLKIISAYRSQEYQDQLRRQSPKSGRAGLAINSPHSTGRALDLYVGGEPVSTKDENRALQTRGAVYLWLVKNAARFGFQPYFYEPWHWEYVGVRSDARK